MTAFSQGAQTAKTTSRRFPPKGIIKICPACCDCSAPRYKVSVNYENKVGSPSNGNPPTDDYYLLWQDDFTNLDTICGSQADAIIWKKQNSNNEWYFPNWLVDIAPSGVAGGSSNKHSTTKNNIFIKNNELIIKLIERNGEYESGALYHIGQDKYGYYEARIKIPDAKKKVFPTFWLFGGACPLDGSQGYYKEIDICDFALNDSRKYGIGSFQSASAENCPCLSKNQAQIFPTKKQKAWLGLVNNYRLNMSKDYFIYGLDWRPDSIVYYINNTRIFSEVNNVTISPLRTIFELKVKSSERPKLSSEGLDYHIDWIKYYKKVEDLNQLLTEIPAAICKLSLSSTLITLNNLPNFLPSATLTTAGPYTNTGSQAANWTTYTSPSLQDMLNDSNNPNLAAFHHPSNLPANNLAAYINLIGGDVVPNNRGANGSHINISIPSQTSAGTYIITINIPGVATNLCPKKTIVIGDVAPPTPSAITIEMGTASPCRCKVIATTSVGITGLSYSWSSNTGGVSGASFINNKQFNYSGCGTETVTVTAYKNGCASGSRTGTVTCYMGGMYEGECGCDGLIKPIMQGARVVRQDSLLSESAIDIEKTSQGNRDEFTSFFPNPITNGQLTINQLKNTTSIIYIFTLQGKKLLETQLNDKEQIIDVSNLSDGFYLLQIQNERGTFNYKIQVRKE